MASRAIKKFATDLDVVVTNGKEKQSMSSKTREALEEVESILSTWIDHLPPVIQEKAQEALNKAEAALAEPLRNCDVGTAEEQGERFILFCCRNSFRGVCNDSCKFANVNRRLGWQKIGQVRCFPFWAQMPYKKEGEQ
jgi:hypothetical protein